MDNESKIVALLTEIRDNQQRQMDANEKAQQDYKAYYNSLMEKQRHRLAIIGAIIGVGIALLIIAVTSK